MRITAQMLNESARKAGLPVNSVSLLNYINKGDSQNTLLSALNKKTTDAANTIKKNDYEKLDKEADKLTRTAEIFLQEGEGDLFERARNSGSTREVCDSVKEMLDNYNSTLKALRTSSNTMNDFYRQMLTEVAYDNRESLEGVGITFKKDGTAIIDEEKLQAADVDSLEKVFGKDSDFAKKTAFLAERISDNVEANVESLSSRYNASGNSYYAASNKYDFWR